MELGVEGDRRGYEVGEGGYEVGGWYVVWLSLGVRQCDIHI